MALSIETSTQEGVAKVSVTGEVDVSNAPELRQALEAALASGAKEVAVAMENVPYIDSTGFGVLVGAAHAAKDAGVRFTIVRPQRNVSRVLALLGVNGELNVTE